ncbi:glycine cleavage system protein H [Allorhodopirellula heiligendammensis]|uniref:Glycine cleavage system H protein n=1 Tax=Allorhodopirellula heiligendammensis TaxID=2714739 RepID=A0A5C6BHA1_9BACT|nr:glycine cleavage system protein H [Allorhodopirellula heiligendammensis]TWU11047.1 Glycine cleavage system H protein [Allorhodopirellula heiligendammensis]
MPESFTFAMGEFDAEFPTDYLYAKNHMWALPMPTQENVVGPLRYRFGLTAYAVRLLQDVYFLEWTVDAPAPLTARMLIGSIESKKAESDLFTPLPGQLTEINQDVLSDPSLINADPYGAAWLIEIEANLAAAAILLSPSEYADHLVEAWEVAQRTIKGQANT